ncbi:arsenate reductase/protein-tyrosine-phosphatase family protein [Vibrio salinus]|uniref:arsenate reductase/protein-tyrosine-phosphatase family protein n=1 Tax=Vibrio salinus TaxID=2899784 RepID=UPI001E393428|nr:ATP-grasp domain-containing protein [Vibrio salinus]MCE0493276.1 ATP-grasp domain-containing protein [Vibrio salinus]
MADHIESEVITERNKKVLVLGEDTRSFLSVIRSLGEAGYSVHVVCYDRTSPALRSRYIETAKFYNYQAFSESEWLDNVISLIDKYQFDLVIPCDERAIYPLWSVRDNLPEQTQLAIANQEALDTLFDKWETKKVAIACNVPVAKGRLVDISKANYSDLQSEFGNKFVIKPLQSFEQSNLSQRQKVIIVNKEDDFARRKNFNEKESVFLIESFFSGKGEGVSVFSVEGEVCAAFAHKRVAEPNSGGGSSYRKTIEIDNDLFHATKSMCRFTKLTGVAMFEFRRNQETGEWILVEVNARFWGSLPLAIFSGVNFPKLYADYLIFRRKPDHPILKYKNVYARSLLADIYEIKREFEIASIQEGRLKASISLVCRLLQIFRIFGPDETIDSFSGKDPIPFLSEAKFLVMSLIISAFRKNKFFLFVRRHRTKKAIRKLFLLNINRRIIFVCYGNIMRSPLASSCMNKLAGMDGELEFDSYGFHLNEQRRSPKEALKAARCIGLDLSEHKSKWLTQIDLKETDIIIYFDSKNREKLSAYYRANHIFCASDLLDNTFSLSPEIEDPYDQSLNGVITCYNQIKNSVAGLIAIYKEVKLCQSQS